MINKLFGDYATRFRGYFPVIIDVETGGLDSRRNPLLEIAAMTLRWDDQHCLHPHEERMHHVLPFEGSICDEKALAFTGIKPDHPFRFAISEKEALQDLFQWIRQAKNAAGCKKAVLVGHNAWFDLSFLNAAVERTQLKRNPFHPFTCFDTATLAALSHGETVLATACKAAQIEFDSKEAHSALYDVQKTGALFCSIVNQWQNFARQTI